MTEKQEGQASISDQGSWSGKMSRSILKQQRKGLPSSPAGNRQRHGRYSRSSSPSERKMAECRMYHGRHLLNRLENA